jgi:hypothetical protein
MFSLMGLKGISAGAGGTAWRLGQLHYESTEYRVVGAGRGKVCRRQKKASDVATHVLDLFGGETFCTDCCKEDPSDIHGRRRDAVDAM